MEQMLEGTIHSVIFTNEENSYTVLRLLTASGEVVTVVGYLPCAAPGERLVLSGHWETHREHGQQFSAQSAERYLPEETADILSYLGSGVIKGVGPATAQAMVDRFGEDTLLVIEQTPEKLSLLKGITAKRAQEISESYRYQTGMRRLCDFLSQHQLPTALAVPLYGQFGIDAMDAIRENPYLLVHEPYGLDFVQLDRIALEMGFSGDNSCRIEAALLFELSYNLNNGHVFLPREKLLLATSQLLGLDEPSVERGLEELVDRQAVVIQTVAKVEACYLRRLYEEEIYSCQKLMLLRSTVADQGRQVEKIIDEIQAQQGIIYAPEQRLAVETAAKTGLLLLTGGPGTGKTTSVQAIVTLFERMGLDVQLAAPTGRAAQRMGELCGRESQTIHRMLCMSYNEASGQLNFGKNEKEPLEADALILDEMSMVDLPLMSALLRALRPGCRLVMVGDADQLPSVGPGNVFSDLIRSGTVPLVALTQIFRQAQQSAIIRNAHTVNLGQSPDLTPNQGDFFFLARRDEQRICSTIVELCQKRLPEGMGIPSREIQVLSPTRKGGCGTVRLNRALQQALNPPSPSKGEILWGDLIFRDGDRVMQVKNNYDICWEKEDGSLGTGIFNGDVGRITKVDPSGEFLQILFDDRLCLYSTELLRELELAYAITVHKAQGSEYSAVVLASPLSLAPSLMVRGVLYTAITRARRLLVIVGDDTTVRQMAANDRQQRRYSGLRWRLKREAAEP